LVTQALPYWQQAGQQAAARSAHAEAISHLAKGLELLKTLPDTPERTQQELALQTTLGPVLVATKGFAAPEVEKTYTRALELCRQIGETPQIIPVLRGLQIFYLVRAEHKTARELGEQLLTLAQRVQDPVFLLGTHLALGQTLYPLGELASAREHLELGIALHDPQQNRSLAWAGSHPGVACLSYMAWVLWHLGYPDQALKRSYEALTLAQELSHPFTLAFALNWAAWLHQSRREEQPTRERAEATITLSTEQGFPLWLAWGTILRGWALAEQGQAEEGITQMRQGLAAWQATGAKNFRLHFLASLADTHRKVGQADEGLTLLAEALATVKETEERYWEAELYRLKGELTLQRAGARGWGLGTGNQRLEAGDWRLAPSSPQVSSHKSQVSSQAPSLKPQVSNGAEQEAEECFFKAIDIARRQQAKSLELRATTSLARLWQQQGKQDEARQILSEIYGWFTEGFDTKDLQEAKALLEELA
jgi:predicted ATPase